MKAMHIWILIAWSLIINSKYVKKKCISSALKGNLSWPFPYSLYFFFYYVQRNFVPFLRWEFLKENKKVRKQENKNSTKKVIKKIRKYFLYFLVAFLVKFLFSWSSSCFLDDFLGRVLVFMFSYFLVFFYKFPPLLSVASVRSFVTPPHL